ncbi:lantibiotic dehydratase, partial [Saccharothrix algeriensis]
ERGTPPPHVDLGARIHAANAAALDRGKFTLTVSPGRAAGTLTSRFTTLV